MIRTRRKISQRSGLASRLTASSLVYQIACRAAVATFPFFPSADRYNITICHERRFVWFRVAKVGTRTIFNEFDKNNIALDAEHPMFVHYAKYLYKSYFKFAFVRNPWDRLVSCWRNKVLAENYFNLNKATRVKLSEFKNFVHYVEGLDIKNCDHHLRLQSGLVDLNNVDFIGRFETFEADLRCVLKTLGINSYDISRKNSSASKNDYCSYYDEGLIEKVGEIYRKDIQLFSYTF